MNPVVLHYLKRWRSLFRVKDHRGAPSPSIAVAQEQIDWTHLFVRRAVGFRLKPLVRTTRCAVTIRRHGRDKQAELELTDLRQLMSLSEFTPAAQVGSDSWLRIQEAHDLVYYSPQYHARSTIGAPLVSPYGLIALRPAISVTLAVGDEEEVAPWVFMPRRGSFDNRFVAGCRLASMEFGTEAYACDFLGDRTFGASVLELLPLLDGRWTQQQVLDQARSAHERETFKWLLSWMDAAALLESPTLSPRLAKLAPPPLRDVDFDSPRSAEDQTRVLKQQAVVTWLGHACVLVNVGSAAVLVDPLFFYDTSPHASAATSTDAAARPPDPRALPPLDAILITHGDNDHLNPHALARLAKSTRVVAPVAEVDRPYQVDIEAVVSALGFQTTSWVKPGSVVQLGDTRVYAYPFVGEDWGLELAKVTYVIEGPLGCVMLSADAAPMPEVFRDIGKRHPIDVAFLGISGCEEPLVAPPRFGYGEFYATWLPHARRNEWQVHCSGPEQSAQAAQLLGARYVFGYAAGAPGMEMSHSDRGSHQELARVLLELRNQGAGGANGAPVPIRLEWGQSFHFSGRNVTKVQGASGAG